MGMDAVKFSDNVISPSDLFDCIIIWEFFNMQNLSVIRQSLCEGAVPLPPLRCIWVVSSPSVVIGFLW